MQRGGGYLSLGEHDAVPRRRWVESAYLRPGEAQATVATAFQVIPRQFWGNCTLKEHMPFAHGSVVEGASRTDLSAQRIYAKLERFMRGEYDSDDSDSYSWSECSDDEYSGGGEGLAMEL